MSISYDPDQTPNLSKEALAAARARGQQIVYVICDEEGAKVGDTGGVSFFAATPYIPRIGEEIELQDKSICVVQSIIWRVVMHAGRDTPLLVPNVRQDLHVDRLGEAVGDRVSLEDPTIGPGHAYTLAWLMPARQTPAPWRPIAIPDPFENHNAVSFSLQEEVLLRLTDERSLPILPKK